MQKQFFFAALLITFITGIGNAQQNNKVAIKLDKLYQSNPEKCIVKCRKYIQKVKIKKTAYYFISLSQFKKYQTSNKDRDLLKVMTSLKHYYKYKKASKLISDTVLLAKIKIQFEGLINQKIKENKLSIGRRYAKKYKQVYHQDIQNIAKLTSPKKIHSAIEDEKATASLSRKSKKNQKTNKWKNKKKKTYATNAKHMLQTAKSMLGVKYKIGGETKKGIDCSGFTKYVYAKEGVDLPHSASSQSKMGKRVAKSDCKPGDLIFFGSKKGSGYKIQHTGMVYSNVDGKLKIIHCPNSGVCIEGDGDTSWDMYWKKRFLFIKRLDNSNTSNRI